MAQEVAEVIAGARGVGEGVEDESSPWIVGGRRKRALGGSARRVQLAF